MTVKELVNKYQYIKDLEVEVYDEAVGYGLLITDDIYEENSIIGNAEISSYELLGNYLYVKII